MIRLMLGGIRMPRVAPLAIDPETQRSTGNVPRVRIGAVRESAPSASTALEFARRVRAKDKYDLLPPTVERMLDALEDEGGFPGFEILRWSVDEGVSLLEHLPDALIACESPDLVESELRERGDYYRRNLGEYSDGRDCLHFMEEMGEPREEAVVFDRQGEIFNRVRSEASRVLDITPRFEKLPLRRFMTRHPLL